MAGVYAGCSVDGNVCNTSNNSEGNVGSSGKIQTEFRRLVLPVGHGYFFVYGRAPEACTEPLFPDVFHPINGIFHLNDMGKYGAVKGMSPHRLGIDLQPPLFFDGKNCAGCLVFHGKTPPADPLRFHLICYLDVIEKL